MTRTTSYRIRAALVAIAALVALAIGWSIVAPAVPGSPIHQARMLDLIVTMLEQGACDHKAQLEIMRDIRQSLRGGPRLAGIDRPRESRHEDPQPE